MRRVPFVASLASSLAPIALLAATSCAVGAPREQAEVPVAAAGKQDADPAALCLVKAEVDDAASRLKLANVRERFARAAPTDRSARFGALQALSEDQERFKAFHEDAGQNPTSAVGPLGECFIYAQWKMADQAAGRCQTAQIRLTGDKDKAAAIVEVARAELHRRRGQLEQAQARIDAALLIDKTCAAALMEGARVAQARGDHPKAFALWEGARAAWPQCYLCAIEAARLSEITSTRAAALPLWEAALALQPDAIDALKSYGAALAGVDDKRALAAYEKAIAAGHSDVSTLMGAAQLAAAAGAVDKAIGFAEQIVQAHANEIDAWRLLLSLSLTKADAARSLKAAGEILRLVEDDLAALVVLARDARAKDQLIDAAARYDAVARAFAAGRTSGLQPGEVEAVTKEHKQLMVQLKVAERPAKGTAASVIASVKNTVQALFVERLKLAKQPATGAKIQGMIEVSVTVSEGGAVDDVAIIKDTLGDPVMAAGVVANLRRAKITGGAKRYSFQLEFM